jgi:hypothetical protein
MLFLLWNLLLLFTGEILMRKKHFIFAILFIIILPECLYGAIIEKEFFSLDLLEGWATTEVTKKNGISFQIVSPTEQNMNAVITLNIYTFTLKKPLNFEKFLDTALLTPMKEEGLEIGEAIPMEEGYFFYRILTPPGGFIFAGIKDNLFDSLMVGAYNSELLNVIQSFRVLEERPYLLSMIKRAISIVNGTTQAIETKRKLLEK